MTVPAPLPPPAFGPAPTDLANGIAQASTLRLQIAANAKRADDLDERFLEAQQAVRAADKKIAATEARITANENHVGALKTQLASRAALLYMGAGNADPIGIDVTSVQDLGAMAKYGDAAAAKDENMLADLQHTENELTSQHDDLEHQRAEAAGRQEKVKEARHEVARRRRLDGRAPKPCVCVRPQPGWDPRSARQMRDCRRHDVQKPLSYSLLRVVRVRCAPLHLGATVTTMAAA